VGLTVMLLGAALAFGDHLLLQVEDFDGPWRRQTNIRGYIGTGFCTSNANPDVAESTMTTEVALQSGGRHIVWVRGYTSPDSRRAFQVQIAGQWLPRTHAGSQPQWGWERAGAVELPLGQVTIVIRDADDGYESADAILITDQSEFDPAADEKRWLVYSDGVPETADALRFAIEACSAALRQHRVPTSPEGWQAAQPTIRAQLAQALGLDPSPERTPLNARVSGRTERDAYVIENVVFESCPHFYVTANVYRPTELKQPAPAIVVVPGHAMEDGKNYPEYQMAEIGLARQGFVVLAYDPIGQGERRLPGFDHHLGYGSLLVGQTNEGMIVWDTIRAVDYLISRPDVDASRLGLTGNSGGGENTFYAMPIEERFQVGTSFCFVCSYEQWLKYGGSHCICNHLPGIVHAMEEHEIIGLNVPRPFLFGNGTEDPIFPIQGTRDTYRQARQIYGLFEAQDRLASVEAPLGHGWARPLREACYGWMNRWLQGRGDGSPVPEADCQSEGPKSPDLLCLKDGQMPVDAISVVDLNRARADTLRQTYAAPPATIESWESQARQWRERLWQILGGRPAETAPTVRRVDAFSWQGYQVETLALTTEPGMEVAGVLVRPSHAPPHCPVVLYLDEEDKARARLDPLVPELLNQGIAVFALDPRGLGETRVHENQLTSDTVCLGRHIFAQRVWDVIQATRYLAGREDVDPRQIRCYGRGAGGLLTLFAAALEAPFDRVSVEDSLASYRYFLEDTQPQPIWLAVPSLLQVVDVPQVVALVCPTRLMIANAVGYGRRPLSAEDAQNELAFAERLYRLAGAENRLFLVTDQPTEVRATLGAFLGTGPAEP
jgi:cephalosporin-C deacetylase-like acetyl esterase